MADFPPGLARPWVVAHRGGAGLAPENTLSAFRQALALGVDALEMDVHLTIDSGLAVIHDDLLERTTNGVGPVSALSVDELRRFDAGAWLSETYRGEPIPSLDDVLSLPLGDTKILVEIKHPDEGERYNGIEAALLDVLRRRGKLRQTVAICFEPLSLQILRDLEPELATGLLLDRSVDLALTHSLGIRFLGPHHRLATAEYIREAHRLGLKVNPWTVDDPADMERLLRDGVDAITTDRPDLLLALLRHQSPAP